MIRAAREPPVVLELGEVGDRQASLVKAERRGAIVATGEWVIKNYRVHAIVFPNCDPVEGLVFCVGSGFCVVLLMLEVSDGEKFKPSFGVWFLVVNGFERCGEF